MYDVLNLIARVGYPIVIGKTQDGCEGIEHNYIDQWIGRPVGSDEHTTEVTTFYATPLPNRVVFNTEMVESVTFKYGVMGDKRKYRVYAEITLKGQM